MPISLLLVIVFLLGYILGAVAESCRYPCKPDPDNGRWWE